MFESYCSCLHFFISHCVWLYSNGANLHDFRAAVATAAVIAIDEGKMAQSVPYEKLKMKLLEDGQVLEAEERNIVSMGLGIDPSKLEGLVIDGAQVKFSGEWVRSSSMPFVGSSYFHDGNTAKECTAEFPFKVEKNGYMKSRFRFFHMEIE